MNVTLFSYAKRANSTARPALSSGTDFSCKLKDTCSIMAPQLEFNLSFTILPQSYNYCYIAEFQRFYFIDNWTYVGRLWVASCVVDVLATHRTEILNSTQYVTRSASRSDGSLTDTLYPLKNDYATRVQSINLNYASQLSAGTYIIGVINGDESAMGCVSYYYMTQTEFNALKKYLLEPMTGTTLSQFLTDVMGTVTDVSEGAIKALFNPLQYVASCYWIPLNLRSATPPTGMTVTDLPFGWWKLTGITAERIAANAFTPTQTIEITLQQHPLAAGRGEYLNAPPYSDTALFLPPYGAIPLDGALCHKLDNRKVTIQQMIDLVTGNGVCMVYGSVSGSFVSLAPVMQAQLGIPIQLSQIATNIASDWQASAVAMAGESIADTLGSNLDGSADTDVLGSVWGAITGKNSWSDVVGTAKNAIGNAIGTSQIGQSVRGISSNIASAARASITHLMSTGINGNIASLRIGAFIIQIFYAVADEDNSHRGRPLCKAVQLSTLSGFTLCADPDISLAAPETEIMSIKAFMAGGFYIQ